MLQLVAGRDRPPPTHWTPVDDGQQQPVRFETPSTPDPGWPRTDVAEGTCDTEASDERSRVLRRGRRSWLRRRPPLKTRRQLSADRDPVDSGSRLRIGQQTVQKTYSDDRDAMIEREKSIAARKLSVITRAFVVPPVVASTRDSTTWTRVFDIVPLRQELSTRHRPELARRVGRALGLVHSRLKLPDNLRETASAPWGSSSVPVHGDFGLKNVQYQTTTNEIVILDWATAAWLGPSVAYAHPHLDVAVFLNDLYYQRPLDPRGVQQVSEIANAFLSGYSEICDPRVHELRRNVNMMITLYWTRAQPGWRRALRLPSLYRLERFLHNLDA